MALKNLCRLLLQTTLSNRQIGEACKVSHNTAGRYRELLGETALTWHDVNAMSEGELDTRLNRGRERNKKYFLEPDWSVIHHELSRVGVTVTLLHEEYADGAGEGVMSEREFRRRYDRYKRSLGLVMRQPLRPGEQLFVDYSGKRPVITDPKIGETTPVELWVGTVGASRKTFAYATPTQQVPDWIDAHVRALEYFGLAPHFLVPDNLKSGVIRFSRKDGHYINPTYQEFADHYGAMVMPARPRRPKDKATVEGAVLLAQRWILARLRNRTFFSIDELNGAINELLTRLNDKGMRSRGGKSRSQLFDELDRPAMNLLPQQRYEFGEWKIGITVPQDYHVPWEGNYYSVPCRLVSKKVDLRAGTSTIDIYHQQKLVASHTLSSVVNNMATQPEHQPPSHRLFGQDQLSDLLAWAQSVGPSTHAFLEHHSQTHPPVASVQACRGLKRLARDYGADRVERACHRALRMRATSISSVRSILVRGMENKPLQIEDSTNPPSQPHENVRGAVSYE